jgi:hypothetical protein
VVRILSGPRPSHNNPPKAARAETKPAKAPGGNKFFHHEGTKITKTIRDARGFRDLRAFVVTKIWSAQTLALPLLSLRQSPLRHDGRRHATHDLSGHDSQAEDAMTRRAVPLFSHGGRILSVVGEF